MEEEVRAVVERLLEGADMDTMTESKVRKMVASQTSLDPASPALKKLVKNLIDDYLNRLNDQEKEHEEEEEEEEEDEVKGEGEEEGGRSSDKVQVEFKENDADKVSEKLITKKHRQREEEVETQKKVKQQAMQRDEDGDIIICQLSAKRNVAVQDWRGKTLVSIREYYEKDGKMLPSSKGISLTAEQWESLKNGIPSIEKAIKSLQ